MPPSPSFETMVYGAMVVLGEIVSLNFSLDYPQISQISQIRKRTKDLLVQPNALNEFVKTRFGAKRVEQRVDLQACHLRIAFLVARF